MRDGAPFIDLLDGQERAELLKRYELGVRTGVGAYTRQRVYFTGGEASPFLSGLRQ